MTVAVWLKVNSGFTMTITAEDQQYSILLDGFEESRTSLSGTNLANNGHSRYAEASQNRWRPAPQAIFFWRVLASESDFVRILSGFLII